jgi:hypothetical protein
MGKLTIKGMRASSILETIAALVIILVIFGIGTSIFVSVSATTSSIERLRATQILKEYADNTEKYQQFHDEQQQLDSFEVRRAVTEEKPGRLWKVQYSIYDRRHSLLAEWQQYALVNK